MRRQPAGQYRRRSRLAAESLIEQILRAGCHIGGPALLRTEPRRRPGLRPDCTKVATYVVYDGWHLVLRKLLHQPEKLLALHAHTRSVRIPPPAGCYRAGTARP